MNNLPNPIYKTDFLDLYHADCMDIMKEYPDKYFDLAIVDPPYGIERFKRNMQNKLMTGFDNKIIEWDYRPNFKYWQELFRVSKNQIIWGGNYFTDNLPVSRGWIYWDKMKYVENFSSGELAWTSFDNVLLSVKIQLNGFLNPDGKKIHPTQKPVALYDWILSKYAKPNQKILDTHFGSGSIAIAVLKVNRLSNMNLHLTAIEIDKEYIEKSIKRIKDAVSQGYLFNEVG